MSPLNNLAFACYHGACNPHGIIASLPEAMLEIPPGTCASNPALKVIIGQLSFLLKESIGPTSETIRAFHAQTEPQPAQPSEAP